jgi:hypothetical protein
LLQDVKSMGELLRKSSSKSDGKAVEMFQGPFLPGLKTQKNPDIEGSDRDYLAELAI